MSNVNPQQTDLRWVLPLRSGQNVLIFGPVSHVAEALQAEGLNPLWILPSTARIFENLGGAAQMTACVTRRQLSLGASSIDHVFIFGFTQQQDGWLVDELGRVVKPGGWILFAAANAEYLGYLRKPRKRTFSPLEETLKPLSLREVRTRLVKKDFLLRGSYGVQSGLDAPEYLIPLERGAIPRYFFDQLFIPYSITSSIMRHLAIFLSQLGLQRIVFKEFIIVAQLSGGQGVGDAL